MGNRGRGGEQFADYQNFLNQTEHWPSDGGITLVELSSMPSRYANSALAKLLRWGSNIQAAVALNISNLDDRLKYIQHSDLGRALAARASGTLPLHEVNSVDARTVVLALVPVIANQATELDLAKVFSLAQDVADKILNTWTVTGKAG